MAFLVSNKYFNFYLSIERRLATSSPYVHALSNWLPNFCLERSLICSYNSNLNCNGRI